MNLPQLKQTETFEATIGGYKLNFRKAVISDSYLLMLMTEEKNSINSLLRIVAELMSGYEETIEQRLEFLKKLDFSNLETINKDINNILKEAGFLAKTEVKEVRSKKK